MFSTIDSGAVCGLQAYLVRVEVDLAGGLPSFQMVGSLGSEVRESRERVCVAMKNSGFQIPPCHITVNLAPAGRRKDGTAFDLPIAVGLLKDMELLTEEAVRDTYCSGSSRQGNRQSDRSPGKRIGGSGDPGDYGMGCRGTGRAYYGSAASGCGK